MVSNDYVVRFRKRFYQLLPPVHPGERGGRVVIEERLDGSMAIRFGKHYLSYQEVTDRDTLGGCAPNPPEFTAWAADASKKRPGRGPVKESGPAGIPPTAGRSGRTPAEPYPPDGADGDSVKRPFRPAKNHPWRKGLWPVANLSSREDISDGDKSGHFCSECALTHPACCFFSTHT